MGWSDIGELVKVHGGSRDGLCRMVRGIYRATACAAWFAAYTAYRGLQRWRDETLGKRKTEVAEQVMRVVHILGAQPRPPAACDRCTGAVAPK